MCVHGSERHRRAKGSLNGRYVQGKESVVLCRDVGAQLFTSPKCLAGGNVTTSRPSPLRINKGSKILLGVSHCSSDLNPFVVDRHQTLESLEPEIWKDPRLDSVLKGTIDFAKAKKSELAPYVWSFFDHSLLSVGFMTSCF